MSVWKRYGFAWITGGLFLFSLAGHFVFGWYAFVQEQAAQGLPPAAGEYLVVMGRDIFENWQSEFLQLMWQVIGLTFFLYIGSPQSKEEDDRLEDKLDAILRRLDPQGADALIRQLDDKYPGRYVGPHLK
jgi:hypothetical protein